ncbi:unnamed protein product [Chrysoparadoxa australica]
MTQEGLDNGEVPEFDEDDSGVIPREVLDQLSRTEGFRQSLSADVEEAGKLCRSMQDDIGLSHLPKEEVPDDEVATVGTESAEAAGGEGGELLDLSRSMDDEEVFLLLASAEETEGHKKGLEESFDSMASPEKSLSRILTDPDLEECFDLLASPEKSHSGMNTYSDPHDGLGLPEPPAKSQAHITEARSIPVPELSAADLSAVSSNINLDVDLDGAESPDKTTQDHSKAVDNTSASAAPHVSTMELHLDMDLANDEEFLEKEDFLGRPAGRLLLGLGEVKLLPITELVGLVEQLGAALSKQTTCSKGKTDGLEEEACVLDVRRKAESLMTLLGHTRAPARPVWSGRSTSPRADAHRGFRSPSPRASTGARRGSGTSAQSRLPQSRMSMGAASRPAPRHHRRAAPSATLSSTVPHAATQTFKRRGESPARRSSNIEVPTPSRQSLKSPPRRASHLDTPSKARGESRLKTPSATSRPSTGTCSQPTGLVTPAAGKGRGARIGKGVASSPPTPTSVPLTPPSPQGSSSSKGSKGSLGFTRQQPLRTPARLTPSRIPGLQGTPAAEHQRTRRTSLEASEIAEITGGTS